MDYTNLICSVLVVLVAIAETFLVPFLKKKIDAEKLTKFLNYVKIAVEAAEQMIGAGLGKEKKEYVVNYLKEKGFNYDEATVSAAIESAVLEMSNNLLDKN